MIKRWYKSNDGEKKTRQITVICKPSIYEAIQKSAYVSKMSSNNLICELMEEYVKTHQDVVAQYDELIKNEV